MGLIPLLQNKGNHYYRYMKSGSFIFFFPNELLQTAFIILLVLNILFEGSDSSN